jgi:hypothetical protein
LLGYIGYIAKFLIYILSSFIINPKLFIVLTIGVFVQLCYKIFKEINKVRSNKDNIIQTGSILLVNIIVLILLVSYSYLYIGIHKYNNNSTELVNSLYLRYIETDEYRNGFEEYNYKNFKILHHKSLEPALPLILAYLDKAEQESSNMLGWEPSSTLTIQLDYDETIFKSRHYISSKIDNVAGYYNIKSNTMYIYVEDVYRDILINYPKVKELASGGYLIDSYGFRETILHEYAHYSYNEFLNENNIDSELIPMWFQEGIAEYKGNTSDLSEQSLEFIPFKDLGSKTDWKRNINTKGNQYLQSGYAIRNIINLKNEKILKEITIKNKEMDFNSAFEQAMDISLENFENKIKEYFDKNNQIYDEPNKSDTSNYTDIIVQCLEAYIHNNEHDIRAYETLTNYYESGDDIEKAIALLKSGIDKNQNESILWRRLGMIYEDNNKIDLANECYKKEKLLKNDK